MKTEVAEILLDSKSVGVSVDEPYTWTSGIKSPIYCDNRRLISFPAFRDEITAGLIKIAAEFGEFDYVAGTATAGIPWAAFVADRLGKPMAYVRSKSKAHGAGKQVEGVVNDGAKVLVVEDLISTGGSSINSANALRNECNAEITGVIAIFSYNFESMVRKMKDEKINFATLSDIDALTEVLVNRGNFDESKREMVLEFTKDPQNWGDKFK